MCDKISREEAEEYDAHSDKTVCPFCGAMGINYRKTKEPYFRCKSCFENFYIPSKRKFYQDKGKKEIEEKIENLFFEEHLDISGIIFEMEWHKNKTVAKLSDWKRMGKYISQVCGFSNLEEAKKEHEKLFSRERRKHGFDKKLRENILERDNHECKLCYSDNNLEIHHIDGDRKNNSEKNLITLCQHCHLSRAHETVRKIDEGYKVVLKKLTRPENEYNDLPKELIEKLEN